MGCLHQVPADPKEVVDGSMDGEKALDVAWGFKPAHLAFPLASRLVGHFGTIICVLIGAVSHGRETVAHQRPSWRL